MTTGKRLHCLIRQCHPKRVVKCTLGEMDVEIENTIQFIFTYAAETNRDMLIFFTELCLIRPVLYEF